MLTDKQRSFLKLITLITTKYATKGIITGLVEGHTMIAEIIASRVKNHDFDKYGNQRATQCVIEELSALARTLIDEEVLDNAVNNILSKHISKIKVEVFNELLDILNDDEINDNLETKDIEFILDDPNIKVSTKDDKEATEAIVQDIVSKTDATEEEVRSWIDSEGNMVKELYPKKEESDGVLEAIDNALSNPVDGKIDLSNVISFVNHKKRTIQ